MNSTWIAPEPAPVAVALPASNLAFSIQGSSERAKVILGRPIYMQQCRPRLGLGLGVRGRGESRLE